MFCWMVTVTDGSSVIQWVGIKKYAPKVSTKCVISFLFCVHSVHLLWELPHGSPLWGQQQLWGGGWLAGHPKRPRSSWYKLLPYTYITSALPTAIAAHVHSLTTLILSILFILHIYYYFIFFKDLFLAFYAFYCTGQWSDDRKRGGEEVGRGLGNDIRPDLKLCPRAQWSP